MPLPREVHENPNHGPPCGPVIRILMHLRGAVSAISASGCRDIPNRPGAGSRRGGAQPVAVRPHPGDEGIETGELLGTQLESPLLMRMRSAPHRDRDLVSPARGLRVDREVLDVVQEEARIPARRGDGDEVSVPGEMQVVGEREPFEQRGVVGHRFDRSRAVPFPLRQMRQPFATAEIRQVRTGPLRLAWASTPEPCPHGRARNRTPNPRTRT
ncbi:hypothetical protein [Agromyces bauzanensis]